MIHTACNMSKNCSEYPKERLNWHEWGFCHLKKMETVASFVNILLKIYVRKLIFQDNGKLEGSGRTSRNATDSSSKQNRKERERGILDETIKDS